MWNWEAKGLYEDIKVYIMDKKAYLLIYLFIVVYHENEKIVETKSLKHAGFTVPHSS